MGTEVQVPTINFAAVLANMTKDAAVPIDFDAVLVNMEKTAGLGGRGVQFLRTMFNRTFGRGPIVRGPSPSARAPAAASPRASGPISGPTLGEGWTVQAPKAPFRQRALQAASKWGGRVGLAGAGLGAAGYGGGLLAHHTGLINMGGKPPSGLSPEQLYRYHTGEYDQVANPLIAEIEAAQRAGDYGKSSDLLAKLKTGDFGGSSIFRNNVITRAVAPWLVGNRGAAYHQSGAEGAERELQNKYDELMKKHVGTPDQIKAQIDQMNGMLAGPMMPQQRRLVQAQLEMLRKRLASPASEPPEATEILQRMRAAGMTPRPYGPTSPAPGGGGGGPMTAPPGSVWGNLGVRPQAPGLIYGSYLNRNDFRPEAEPPPPAYDPFQGIGINGLRG